MGCRHILEAEDITISKPANKYNENSKHKQCLICRAVLVFHQSTAMTDQGSSSPPSKEIASPTEDDQLGVGSLVIELHYHHQEAR